MARTLACLAGTRPALCVQGGLTAVGSSSRYKANVELSPIDGAAIAAPVAKSAATPRDVIRRYNSLIAAPR